MTTIEHPNPSTIDPAAIEAYTGLVAGHASMAINAALAERAAVVPRYLREWLSAMTASGFVGYDAAGDTFELSAAGAAVLADEDSPALFVAPFQFLPLISDMLPALRTGFRTGTGF